MDHLHDNHCCIKNHHLLHSGFGWTLCVCNLETPLNWMVLWFQKEERCIEFADAAVVSDAGICQMFAHLNGTTLS